jgi:hypothetical protein
MCLTQHSTAWTEVGRIHKIDAIQHQPRRNDVGGVISVISEVEMNFKTWKIKWMWTSLDCGTGFLYVPYTYEEVVPYLQHKTTLSLLMKLVITTDDGQRYYYWWLWHTLGKAEMKVRSHFKIPWPSGFQSCHKGVCRNKQQREIRLARPEIIMEGGILLFSFFFACTYKNKVFFYRSSPTEHTASKPIITCLTWMDGWTVERVYV